MEPLKLSVIVVNSKCLISIGNDLLFLSERLDQDLCQLDRQEPGQEEDPAGSFILRLRQAWMCE